jgi:thiol-disulfide isomerase/thioredoxin
MRKRINLQNIVFAIIIILLIIPQTRQSLQVILHKGLSYINQSTLIDRNERNHVTYSDWNLKSDTDTIINFKDTRGKVVFVNFWATWCPPCIAEMPSLQSLYNDYNDKVLFIFSTSDDFETIKAFKEKHKFSFNVYRHSRNIPKELETSSIPRTFIINKNGEIVVDESGAVDWNSEKVRSQLNQLLAE